MSTPRQRASSVRSQAVITPVRLARRVRPARWTRRHLLVNTGFGTAGVAILAACGSDSSGDAGSAPSDATTGSGAPGSSTSPEPAATASATSPSSEPATSDVASTGDGSDADDELRLQHVSFDFVSAFVLVRGREAAVVDTGTEGGGSAIVDALSELGLAPADVRHIILTHNHGDHIGGLASLEGDMMNATVYAGPGDVDTIETALALTGVADGDEIFGMGVVATPGHTPGSISVFDTDTGLLVAGDAITGDGEGGISGPNPEYTPDMATAEASVAKLAELMPEVAAFGHVGPPVTDDVAAKLAALTG